MNRHIEQLDRQLSVEHRLRDRLAAMVSAIGDRRDVQTRELLDTLEDMVMLNAKVRSRIPGLVYADVAAACDFLTHVFGLEAGRVDRDAAGVAQHAELTAGDGVIWLHRVAPEYGLQSPQTAGCDTAGLSVMVDDVDAHYRHAKDAGAVIVYEPADMPYGVREYGVRDSENRLWSFMTPIE